MFATFEENRIVIGGEKFLQYSDSTISTNSCYGCNTCEEISFSQIKSNLACKGTYSCQCM